jgi:hypothetical protein
LAILFTFVFAIVCLHRRDTLFVQSLPSVKLQVYTGSEYWMGAVNNTAKVKGMPIISSSVTSAPDHHSPALTSLGDLNAGFEDDSRPHEA